MTKKLAIDIAERTFWTYVQSFIGLLLAASVLDISTVKAAAVSAIPAALAVIKGFAASRIGDATAAALPPTDA